MVKRPTRKTARKGAKRGPKEERLVIPPEQVEGVLNTLLTRPKPKKR
jgi:hypothetical protein